MSRYRDNSPVGHTCPKIDEVISAISSVDWEDTYWTKKDLIDTMEEIRKANGTLREWGNDECRSKSEYEDEKDELEKEVKNLKSDLSDLQDEITDLKAEIETLEEKLSNVESVA